MRDCCYVNTLKAPEAHKPYTYMSSPTERTKSKRCASLFFHKKEKKLKPVKWVNDYSDFILSCTQQPTQPQQPPNLVDICDNFLGSTTNESCADSLLEELLEKLPKNECEDTDLAKDEYKPDPDLKGDYDVKDDEEDDPFLIDPHCSITAEEWNLLASTPLYPNSSTTQLEAIILVHQYILNANATKTDASHLIKLLCHLLPNGHSFPPTFGKFLKVHVVEEPQTHVFSSISPTSTRTKNLIFAQIVMCYLLQKAGLVTNADQSNSRGHISFKQI